jgi:2-polyprenyl-3-methyl-5-hydroxy-6-metoxy-1,4-benzoquinol methylase
LLDIGARTGDGSNLLGEMFADEKWGYPFKLVVDTIDINTDWNDYIKLQPWINAHSNTDLFNLKENSYDIVFCSHVIEHLEKIVDFVAQAKKVASKFAFFTCPFNEQEPIAGHKTVTKAIIDQCEPNYFKTYLSVNRWKPDLACVVFALRK